MAEHKISWLVEHIEETLGEKVDAAKLRVILRNLVKSGELEHEAGKGWTFSGAKDPAVKQVIAVLKKRAEAPAEKPKKKVTKKAAKKEEVEETEEFDEDELDLD